MRAKDRHYSFGFTLIELIVAMALLVMMLGFGVMIFNVSIDSYRTSQANSGIMRKARAITEQMRSDFAGLRKEVGIYSTGSSIVFFADGDFQSTDTPLVSNVACITYGRVDPNMLVRQQVLLTSNPGVIDANLAIADANEFCRISLSQARAQMVGPNPILSWSDLVNVSVTNLTQMADGVSEFQVKRLSINVAGELQWPSGSFSSVPAALKFEFTIKDSKDIISNGRKFTQIVYLGD